MTEVNLFGAQHVTKVSSFLNVYKFIKPLIKSLLLFAADTMTVQKVEDQSLFNRELV